MTEKPSFYAILPASVRYDPRLKAAEKIMFAEITALTNARGYCFAQNSYFEDLYGVSKSTVKDWLHNLSDAGYIEVEIVRDDRGQVTERQIRASADPRPENRPTPRPENRPTPRPENRPYNNTREEYYKSIINPPHPLSGVEAGEDELYHLFLYFNYRACLELTARQWRRVLEYMAAGVHASLVYYAVDKYNDCGGKHFGYICAIIDDAIARKAYTPAVYDTEADYAEPSVLVEDMEEALDRRDATVEQLRAAGIGFSDKPEEQPDRVYHYPKSDAV